MDNTLDRASRTALACLAVIATAVALVRIPAFWGTIQDDGFIYLRIAANAAHGHGPVFNPGEHVDAATSPVWTALLTAAARLGAPLTVAAPLLGLVCAIGTILLTARWIMELAPPRTLPALLLGLLPAVVLVADARFWLYAFSGMETSLAALVWIWASRALVQRWFLGRKAPVAGWALLAACLVRPEFVVVVLGFAVVALVKRSVAPRVLARTLLPAIVGGAAYLGAHTVYFGDPLPNTYYAKRASDWAHVRIGLAYLRGLPATYPALLFALLALAAPGLRGVAAGFALGVLLFTVHVVGLGGDHFVFYRPYVFVRPIALALTGAAVVHIWTTRSLPIRIATTALAFAGLLLSSRARVPAGAFAWVHNAAQLGYTLARIYPPETRVGMFAIGAAGYTSGLPVVDALGLADRTVARHDLSHEHVCALDIGHERGDPAYVLDHADVVVFFGAFAPIPFENLEEVREGFYSQKKFLAAARIAVDKGRFRLRDVEFAPGAHWAVLEKVR